VYPVEASRRSTYLRRLGFDRPPPVDADGLRALHLAHLRTFPFENLDIGLGRPILLDGEAILAKLLDQGRGGYCYELNSAFGSLLASLGFDVELLEARVYGSAGPQGEAELGIRFDHACLQVRFDESGDGGGGGDRLADVGFGSCFWEPIRLEDGVDQVDPTGTYRLAASVDGWLDLERDGTPQYRLSRTPRVLADFADGNHHQQTSPSSPFTKNTVCSLATADGRITVRGLQLIETTGDDRTESTIPPDRLGTVLSERFGIELSAQDVSRLASAGS